MVAKTSPPITARPSGAFCSALSAIGAMPMIMASAVMSTGRKRVNPASIAAVAASAPSASRSRAKLTTRMLLAVATPMHMIAPVNAGTDKVVRGDKQHPDDAGERRRQRRDDDERIEPGLEVDDDQQINQHDRERDADEQLAKAEVMVVT